jgi:hypothetical protein
MVKNIKNSYHTIEPCAWVQGDPIGRIFADWKVVFFGQFLNYKSSPTLGCFKTW